MADLKSVRFIWSFPEVVGEDHKSDLLAGGGTGGAVWIRVGVGPLRFAAVLSISPSVCSPPFCWALVQCVSMCLTHRGLDYGGTLAHASMLRRLLFSAWETVPRTALKTFHISLGKGYGSVGELTDDRGDIYLPCANAADAQWASVEAARKWVLRQLEAQGVQLTAAA